MFVYLSFTLGSLSISLVSLSLSSWYAVFDISEFPEVLLVLEHRVRRPSHLYRPYLGVQETVDRHSLQQQPAAAGGGSQPQ